MDKKTIIHRWKKGIENLKRALIEFDQIIIFNTSKPYSIELSAIVNNKSILFNNDSFVQKELKVKNDR